MAEDRSTRYAGSTSGASESTSESTGSGQVGGAGENITRHSSGSGRGDKWSQGNEEYSSQSGQSGQSGKSGMRGGQGGAGGSQSGKTSGGQSMTDAVSSTVSDAGQKLQQTARNVADDAQNALGGVTRQVQQDANSLLSEQKEMVASRLSGFANTLRETGDRLQQENEDTIGQYAQSVAGQIDRVAGYLQNHDAADLMDEVRSMARRQPEIFLAGSLAVGFLLGRFLKASGNINLPSMGGGHSRVDDNEWWRQQGARMNDYQRRYQGGGYQGGGYQGSQGSGYRQGGEGETGGYQGRQGSSYPDLQYRDAMRGDQPYREQSFRGDSGRMDDGGQSSSGSSSMTGNADRDVNSSGAGYDDQSRSGEMNPGDRGSVRGSQAA